MNVSGVGFPSSQIAMGGSQTGENPRLRALEQKLEKLNKEKEKAVKSKNRDKVRELEKEIEQVRQQIEELKQKEKKKNLIILMWGVKSI